MKITLVQLLEFLDRQNRGLNG